MAGAAAASPGKITVLPGYVPPPNISVCMDCKTPDVYEQAVFVNFFIMTPGIVAERIGSATDRLAETPIGTYTHGSCQYRIVCFLMMKHDHTKTFPIILRHLVTGVVNDTVVHEYYGLTRCHDAKPLLKELYRLNGRSAGEMLNTYLFSKLYKYISLNINTDDDSAILTAFEDTRSTTVTWVGIDYFGKEGSELEEKRRLQQQTDGAFVFPNCIYTMTNEQSETDSAILPYGNPFAITGREETTPLGFKPQGIRFISGYSSRILEEFKKSGFLNTKKIEIRNSHFINGIDKTPIIGSGNVLERQHEVGGVMTFRSAINPVNLPLDTRAPQPDDTEPARPYEGLYKFRGDQCYAPMVKSSIPKVSPSDLDYGLHTHPLKCYVINSSGFGPPSEGDLLITLRSPYDGQIVYSYEGEWMIQVNPIIKHAFMTRRLTPSILGRFVIPDDWEARSRSRASEMFTTDNYIPSGENAITLDAVGNYLKVLGELRVVLYGAVDVPIFHCQYWPRVLSAEQTIPFVVPTQKIV
uniref:Uncharacterized protein n=1 Tax=viral metagenome TaxID=1070528 RepID=A0A6C0J5I9_9ZZZZ